MAKLKVGQAVQIAFNAPRPDLRVPNQANGASPGRGDYQTEPETGVVLEVGETDSGPIYLVEVELRSKYERNGVMRERVSFRKRHIPESKLTPV